MSHDYVSVVSGVGACLPGRVITNDDLVREGLNTSDDWILARTGIARRRRAEPGTSTGDLAVEAGAAALAAARTARVDLVILATTTPDHPCPATAPEVAMRLGLTGTPAFDLAAVCSGFVYALAAADSWIRSAAAETVLVVAAETYSTIVDPGDRNTAAIFGDGAGAVLLRRGRPGVLEPGAVLAVDLGSDGTGADFVMIEAGGSRWPDPRGLEQGAARSLQMKGREVYGHAVRRMTASSQRVLARAGWTPQSLGAFIGHQANQRILDSVADRLGIPDQRRFGNIRDVGNTAAASIPLVLADTVTAGLVEPGTRTLLTAFGGGLTWGSVALTWPDITTGPADAARLHRENTLEATNSTTYTVIADVLTEKFEIDRALLHENATFRDLELDSIAVVELFVTLSDHWQIPLDDSDAVPDLTLAATAALVERAQQGSPA